MSSPHHLPGLVGPSSPDARLSSSSYSRLKDTPSESQSTIVRQRAPLAGQSCAAMLDDSANSSPDGPDSGANGGRPVVASSDCLGRARRAMEHFMPISSWAPRYSLRNDLVGDLLAGLTVGLMVVPQAMAYALIAQLSIITGLFSALVGCVLYAPFGTSRDLNVGPTSVLSLLVLSSYVGNAAIEDDAYMSDRLAQALLMAFFAGLCQLTFGLFNLGLVLDFISHPIISGFTSASALTIASVQLKNLTGIPVQDTFIKNMYAFITNIDKFLWIDSLLGAVCIIMLWSLSKLKRYGREGHFFIWLLCTGRNALIVFLSTLLSFISTRIHSTSWFVTVPQINSTQQLLPTFSASFFSIVDSPATLTSLFLSSVAIACIGILEGIAVAKALAKQNGYSDRLRASQELISTGICQALGCFVGSYPIGGSFSRSAVNSQAGIRTPMGGVFAGIILLFALLFATPLFHFIPQSALAAVIISAVFTMIDFDAFLTLYRMGEPAAIVEHAPAVVQYILEFTLVVMGGLVYIPFCLRYRRHLSTAPQAWYDLFTLSVSFWGCLLFSIEIGIAVAVAVSLCLTLFRASTPDVVRLDPHSLVALVDNEMETARTPLLQEMKSTILCVRINGSLCYYSISCVLQKIVKLQREHVNLFSPNELVLNNSLMYDDVSQTTYAAHISSSLNDTNYFTDTPLSPNGLSKNQQGTLTSLKASGLYCLIMDCIAVNEADTSGANGLESMIRDLSPDVPVFFVHAKPLIRDLLITAFDSASPPLFSFPAASVFFESMPEATTAALLYVKHTHTIDKRFGRNSLVC